MSKPILYFNSGVAFGGPLGPPLRFAFDFFGTLDTHEDVRALARALHRYGQEIHIVSSISPGLPFDSDERYAEALQQLDVPFTKVWRVDHDPLLKVAVLQKINARAFWDDVEANVVAARSAGFSTCHVGKDPDHLITEVSVRHCWETPK